LPRSEKNKKNSGNANPHGPFVDSESDAHGVETGLRDLIPTRHRHLYLTDAARDTNPEKKQTHKKQTMKRTAPPPPLSAGVAAKQMGGMGWPGTEGGGGHVRGKERREGF
jgi:hypothetical protein